MRADVRDKFHEAILLNINHSTNPALHLSIIMWQFRGLLETLVLALTLVQTFSYSIKLQNRFTLFFKPLIGGPEFLKLHVSIQYDDPSHGRTRMDFVPERPEDADAISNLIRGLSVDGKVRELNAIDKYGNELDQSKEDLDDNCNRSKMVDVIRQSFDPQLNLYKNNCYHFAYHFYQCVQKGASAYS